LLIANRGEVAFRIIRACKQLNIETVAAYTKVDADARYLDFADRKICIGERDYLNIPALISAAQITNCNMIHPGYGFLSESGDFARAVVAAGIEFVGPTAELIELMGDKATARETVSDLGIKVVEGSRGEIDPDQVQTLIEKIGLPVCIKASFGGGGKGMRVVTNIHELNDSIIEAQQEAQASFGKSTFYVEKFMPDARHIEVQILGDGSGKVVHLGTRECSIQRRYQKLIEEAPAEGIEAERLDGLLEQCVEAMSRLRYRNAGTLEFLYSGGEFHFIEMNTRLQVEHPVTESISGRDIVEAQIYITMEGQLPFQQSQIEFRGNAIECRINAETDQFMPSPGLVSDYHAPGGPGVRVDSHLFAGYTVPHQYDSLIVKVITTGDRRETARRRMFEALDETVVGGISTNIGLLKKVLQAPDYVNNLVSTGFVAKLMVDGKADGTADIISEDIKSGERS